MSTQIIRCSSCGRQAHDRFLPSGWLYWLPCYFSGDSHDDDMGEFYSKDRSEHYCEECGPSCGKCSQPVLRKNGQRLHEVRTKNIDSIKGGQFIYFHHYSAFHENCYHQYCQEQEEAREKKKLEEKAKTTPLVHEFKTAGSLIESHKLFLNPIDFNRLGKGFLGGAIFLVQIGPVSAILGLILAVIFNWSWFWWTTAIGLLAGFLIGFDVGYSKSYYRSSND